MSSRLATVSLRDGQLEDRVTLVEGAFLVVTRWRRDSDPRSDGWSKTAISFRLPLARWREYRAVLDLVAQEAALGDLAAAGALR